MKTIFAAALSLFAVIPVHAQRELTGFEEGFFRKGITVNTQQAPNDSVIRGDTQPSLLFIDASEDRVGISTGLPQSTLDVNGDVRSTGGQFIGSGAGLTGISTSALPNTYDSSTTWRGAGIEISSGAVKVTGDSSTAFQVGASTLVILGSGNVGIGTVNPDSRLDVVDTNANLKISNANGSTLGYNGSSVTVTASAIQNIIGNTEISRWTATGLGVGTVSPLTALHVSGASNLVGVVTVFGASMTVGGNAFSVGGSTLDVRSSSVTIGSNSPGSLLSVYGSAQFGTGATVSTFSRTGALTMPANADLITGAGGQVYHVSSVTIAADNSSANIAPLQIGEGCGGSFLDTGRAMIYACSEANGSNFVFRNVNSVQGALGMDSLNGFLSMESNHDLVISVDRAGTPPASLGVTTIGEFDFRATNSANPVKVQISTGGLQIGGDYPIPVQIGVTSMVMTSSGFLGVGVSTGAPRFIVARPSAQTIAASDVITADACGTVKEITAGGAVTTNTVDTFTASSSITDGCCMDVVNTGANPITLDNNAEFFSAGAVDVVLGTRDTVRVCSDGTVWTQIGATGNN